MRPLVTKLSGQVQAVGSTALWTPSAGKRFELLGYSVIVRWDSTSAAGSRVTLRDSLTDIFNIASIPVGALNQMSYSTVNLPGDGYLGSADGAVLYVNLDAVATAGGVYVNVWGYEV